jgi:hypothetical protein
MSMQLCLFSQRWRDRRESYRPAGEPINPRLYEVGELAGDREAKAFILAHHYSLSYPSPRVRFGLFTRGCLVGVAVFSHPCNDRVLTSVFPLSPLESVKLGRFVLLDSVPANGESWFLARTFECLRRKGLSRVVSFSDPVPRARADGTIVHRGHVGICYQASSATFLGRTEPRTIRLLPDGTVLNDRTIQKIRSREQGWRYAAALLETFGADSAPSGDREDWLRTWLPRLTRRLKHSGNYKYGWPGARAATCPIHYLTRNTEDSSMAHPFPLFEPIWSPSCEVLVTPEITSGIEVGAAVAIGVSGGKDSAATALATIDYLRGCTAPWPPRADSQRPWPGEVAPIAAGVPRARQPARAGVDRSSAGDRGSCGPLALALGE